MTLFSCCVQFGKKWEVPQWKTHRKTVKPKSLKSKMRVLTHSEHHTGCSPNILTASTIIYMDSGESVGWRKFGTGMRAHGYSFVALPAPYLPPIGQCHKPNYTHESAWNSCAVHVLSFIQTSTGVVKGHWQKKMNRDRGPQIVGPLHKDVDRFDFRLTIFKQFGASWYFVYSHDLVQLCGRSLYILWHTLYWQCF